MGTRSLPAAAVVSALALLPVPAHADKVLVFQHQDGQPPPTGGDQAGVAATAYLKGLGHDVTFVAAVSPTMPADLTVFDTVWAIQVTPFTGPQETQLVEFVARGGGLYISGERFPCCEGLNRSVQNIHNRLALSITGYTNLTESGDDFVRATDTFGITTTPNDIPIFKGGEAGTIGANLPLKNQVYKKAVGDTFVMGAWAGEDMKNAGGCLVINMDLSFWFPQIYPEQDKAKLTENIERFLMTCNDRDHDGASDVAETKVGTDPDDPDSDDDGLCDGYGQVAGTCIPGERGDTDTDSDGLIDPLDPDDDNDTLPTSYEVAAELAKPDADDYNDPAWLDVDSDNNNIPDRVEGREDFDHDGIPAIVDLGDDPENCDADEDCAVHGPEYSCDQDAGFCRNSGNSNGGTGGAPGSGGGSSSGDAAAGRGNVDAGVGDGGSTNGSGGRDSTGGRRGSGSTSSSGGESGDSGDDAGRGGSRRRASDSGCNCSLPGRSTTGTAPLSALLGLALLARRRRTR